MADLQVGPIWWQVHLDTVGVLSALRYCYMGVACKVTVLAMSTWWESYSLIFCLMVGGHERLDMVDEPINTLHEPVCRVQSSAAKRAPCSAESLLRGIIDHNKVRTLSCGATSDHRRHCSRHATLNACSRVIGGEKVSLTHRQMAPLSESTCDLEGGRPNTLGTFQGGREDLEPNTALHAAGTLLNGI